MKALLGGAKRVMLSLAEEASPLGTAAGAIVAVSVRVAFTVGRWECFWRRRIAVSGCDGRKMLRAVADAFNRVAENEMAQEFNLVGMLRNCKC